jgi:hypothetical protein
MQLLIICLEALYGRLVLLQKELGVLLVFRLLRLCLTRCILGNHGFLRLLLLRGAR